MLLRSARAALDVRDGHSLILALVGCIVRPAPPCRRHASTVGAAASEPTAPHELEDIIRAGKTGAALTRRHDRGTTAAGASTSCEWQSCG